MDGWQSCSCQRPDIRSLNNFLACLGCGSTNIKPAIIQHASTDTDLITDSDYDSDSPYSQDDRSDDDDLFSDPQRVRARSGDPDNVYQQLEENSIRLLHIKPGDFNDELVCELVHEGLNSLPVYEAISYTWAGDSGDRSRKKSILLGSRILRVTTSCHLALQRARLQTCLVVWIDAICINQADNAERSHQVQMMARIYARARKVLVYIGEGNEASSSIIRRLGKGEFTSYKEATKAKAEVAALLARPYFWRVWVLQEIALAKEAVLICGDVSTPWLDFSIRIRELPGFKEMAHRALLTRPSPHETYGFNDNSWSPFGEEASGINGVPLALSFIAPTLRGVQELPRLLDLSSFCEATEPRDKVYALLGLATGTEGYGFVPDYDADLETVYTRTAMLIATSCGVMSLLARAVCRRPISPALP